VTLECSLQLPVQKVGIPQAHAARSPKPSQAGWACQRLELRALRWEAARCKQLWWVIPHPQLSASGRL